MSISLSLDASKTPTPPVSNAKLNGSVSPLRFSALNMNAYQSTNNKNSVGNGVIGGSTTPNLMATPTPGNMTINSTKALLDLSRGSLHVPTLISPGGTPGSPPRRQQQPLMSGLNRHYDDHRDQDLLGSPMSINSTPVKRLVIKNEENDSSGGIYQTLASLALLCLLSLLMSFLALFFLQKIGPPIVPSQLTRTTTVNGDKKTRMETGNTANLRVVISSEEYFPVYQVAVALSTLTMALDLCCLFVCCIQFLFAIKLLKTPHGEERTNKFLKRSSTTRVIAIGGFFLSIPIFFTGVILFTFIHFQEVPAIATSVAIGIGIVFCGIASVQNVYLWQWEKTRASREQLSKNSRLHESTCSTTAPDVTVHTMELSTLV